MDRTEMLKRLSAVPEIAQLSDSVKGMLLYEVYNIAEEAYIEGKRMSERLIRMQLGIAVEDDYKEKRNAT